MKLKKMLKAGLAVVLAVILTVSASVIAVGAYYKCEEPTDFTITRISNPENVPRMADGLVEGGDRENSYAWCMTERGDNIYIGTNTNLGGLVVNTAGQQLAAAGMPMEMVWDLVDVLTNGEIPRTVSTEGGKILRCNKETGKIDIIYTAPSNVAFRMAITFGDSVYFGSFSSDGKATNDIFKIDEEDNVNKVYTAVNGTSMRAACTYQDDLYFGGVDATEVLDEGDEACQKLAVIRKDAEDDAVWHRVADYKDFDKAYSTDSTMFNTILSPIWDIVEYDGYIYATLPNNHGFVMYRGRPAEEGEEANEYGWIWEEVIGKNNGINNLGLCDSAEGYTGTDTGIISTTATPFIFNDELYVMDFDMTIMGVIQAVTGALSQLKGSGVTPSQYLNTLYSTLKHNQSVWKLDNETGVFNRIDSLDNLVGGTCDEYFWRAEVYNGELYITTMDSATIYNYITKLTNGSFAEMSPEEFESQIAYIKNFIDKYLKTEDVESADEIADELTGLADTASNMVDDINNMDLTPEEALEFLAQYANYPEIFNQIVEEAKAKVQAEEETKEKIQDMINKIKAVKDKIVELYNSIDWKGLEMYAYISDMVSDDTWGFDMFKSADGENFVPVTIDGLGDKYNYGGRTLLAADNGLYIGTANPFYGAQLYLLTNNSEEPTEVTEDTESTEPTEIPEIVPGDADGDGEVTIRDTALLQMFLSNKTDEYGNPVLDITDPMVFASCDVNGDGIVDVIDITMIQMNLAGFV